MNIIRAPRPSSNFYLLDKGISEDRRLSWAARGLLIFLLGKPDHWQVSVAHLRNETADCAKPTGRDGVYSLLDELITAGYVLREQARAEAGKLGQVRYLVSEIPHTESQEAAPLPAQPYPAEPLPANPTQVSIEEQTSIEGQQSPAEAAGPTPVQQLFMHWQVVMASPRAKLDDKRRRLIAKALKTYSLDDLKRAVAGCSRSAWHMGQNDRNAKYNSLELILRDAQKIEQFMGYFDNPPAGPAPKLVKPTLEQRHAAAINEFLDMTGGKDV